jgi:5-methylcytosine-specific restriction enzyme subunit McrC
MLIYSYDIKLENEQLASCLNHKHDFIEVFIQMFARNLLKELQKGIYKEYITQEDNLTTLRGKYLINENLKYNFTKS